MKSQFVICLLLFITTLSLAQSNKNYVPNPIVSSQDVGTSAYLKGDYLEMGIRNNGCLYATDPVPSGYHPAGGYPTISMVSDYQKDGWTNGTPPKSGDYFIPGGPFEGFKVEFNGTVYHNNVESTSNIPGSNQPIADEPTLKKALWTGGVSGSFSVKQRVELSTDKTYAIFKMVLKNTSSSSANIYYSRLCDPDNEYNITSSFTTIQTIVSQHATSGKSIVKAVGTTHGIYLGLASGDPRSKAAYTTTGWSLKPSDFYNGTAGASNSGTNTADEAIAMAFYFPNVAPSDSVVFEYAYLTRQADEAEVGCATATLSGTQAILAGNSANLTVNFTGTGPWTFVMNGVTYLNIAANPYTVTVSPAVTTTYTISSVTNACGAGSPSGSATVTVCQPSELAGGTITGSQTIFQGQSADLFLNFTGNPPWTPVLNGTTLPPISITPYTVTVSPTTTTTYNLTSVRNGCGTTTVSSSATVTICTPPTATLTGTQAIAAGQTANLSVAFTGGPSPWSLTFNGQTYTNITTTPFIIPVTPTTSPTTYMLTSTGNICGTGTVTGTATITFCVPPTAALSGNQTITEGEIANLQVNLTGTSPWAINVNGTNYTNITTSPYTLSVTPSSTTTYTLSSVSNVCGANLTTSSANVIVTPNFNLGLVSCYAFNTNSIDGIGKNNGVINGATLTDDRYGRISNAYNYDGDDYISITSEGTANNNYTYAAWVNPSNLPTNGEARTILSVGNGQVLMLANLANTGNTPAWYFWGYEQGTSATPSTSFPVSEANRWYHVVAVRTNTAYKIYVDGVFRVQLATSNLPQYSNNATFFGIRSLATPFYWQGKIDDARIYNTALNDDKIALLYALGQNENCDALVHVPNGLLSCYSFSGDTKDEVSVSHGTASSITLTADRFGNANNAYTFSGSSPSTVSLSNPSAFANNNYTYSAWIKVNTLPSVGGLQWIFGVGQHGVGDQTLYIHNNSGTISFVAFGYVNPTNCVAPLISGNVGVTVQANRWYHITVTMGSTLYSLYLDGKLIASSPSTCTSMTYGSPSANIGSRLGTMSYFNGVIDDLRVYNRAITEDEVKTLRFTKGCRTKCPELATLTSPYSSPLHPTRVEASEVVGTNLINPTTEVRYDGSKSVLLQPGFKVEQGAVFEAIINGCGSNK